jgi:hypothetical protein
MPDHSKLPIITPEQQQLVREALTKMSGADTATTAFLPPTQLSQFFSGAGTPDPERAPYELGEGEEVSGDHWASIRRFGSPHPRIEFEDRGQVCDKSSCPRLPALVVGPAGDVCLSLDWQHADTVKTTWGALSLQLGEVLKTARANYGEGWGK